MMFYVNQFKKKVTKRFIKQSKFNKRYHQYLTPQKNGYQKYLCISTEKESPIDIDKLCRDLQPIIRNIYLQVTNIEEDCFAFQFEFPNDSGLQLHSISIVDQKPGMTFRASDPYHHPSITEEDVAIMAKLAMESKRPEFFFLPIPKGYPFHGRQYKFYSPQWIKDTSIGDLLFEVDWAMKCISIGSKSNEEKTEFCSRQKASGLQNLAINIDFPHKQQGGSIIMSCKSVKVKETDECLTFVGEPEMRITDDACPTYGHYITANYDSVAYHDEPLFLKMKEIIKLILAMEWFVRKGIKFNRKWILKHLEKKNPLHSKAVELYSERKRSAGDNYLQMAAEKSLDLEVSRITCGMPCPHNDPHMSIHLTPSMKSELLKQTVPWPTISLKSKENGQIFATSSGGVSTSSIPVLPAPSTAATTAAPPPTLLTKSSRKGPETITYGPYFKTKKEITVTASKKLSKKKSLRRRDVLSRDEYHRPPTNLRCETPEASMNRGPNIKKEYGPSDPSVSFNEDDERQEVSAKKTVSISSAPLNELNDPSHFDIGSECESALKPSPPDHQTMSVSHERTMRPPSYGVKSTAKPEETEITARFSCDIGHTAKEKSKKPNAQDFKLRNA